jgi:hypothetical protein
VAGVIERGLAVGLGVGIADGVAGTALLGTTVGLGVVDAVAVGLGVVVPEQATTARSREKIEAIRARRPVRILTSSVIYVAVAS